MSRTRIDWADYTINPVKGLCPVACSYCYGRRLYQRFKWDPEIRYEDPFWQFHALKKKQPSRVFIGSTMELFGPWIRPEWMHSIISFCKAYPQHTFIFLTKKPENLPKSWPDNCWVGVTATDQESYYDGVSNIALVNAKVKFVSFEPLLEQINGGECAEEYRLASIDEFDWAIIGLCTPVSTKTMPKLEWIQEIVDAADKACVPVFCKDNLDCLIGQDQQFKRFRGYDSEGNMLVGLRQEFPKVKSHA